MLEGVLILATIFHKISGFDILQRILNNYPFAIVRIGSDLF
jgi:hypothetical protein